MIFPLISSMRVLLRFRLVSTNEEQTRTIRKSPASPTPLLFSSFAFHAHYFRVGLSCAVMAAKAARAG
jgi:hypothetical protein